MAEYRFDLVRRLDAECADQDGNGELAVFVDTYVEHVIRVRLVFEPRTAVGDNRSREHTLTGFVNLLIVVHAGGADDLRNDDALRTVDDERSVIRHEREITHEDFGLFDLTCQFVGKTNFHLEGGCIVYIALFAFRNGILWLCIKRVGHKIDEEIARIVGNGGHIPQNLHEAFFEKPFVGLFLHLNEVRHLESLVDFGKAHSDVLADFLGLNHFQYHSVLFGT